MTQKNGTELEFYRGKRVFVTGATGFKGSWLCHILKRLGAQVTGFSLAPEAPSLFETARVGQGMHSVIGDIREPKALLAAMTAARPEIVFHLAAQAIVREGYRRPVDTYSTNVMGTVHLLECVRQTPSVRSFVNVTTDKVYENHETGKAFREEDRLNGGDPYSNSKSCSELVTQCYKNSFLKEQQVAVSTVRAGNVIGGGDFSAERILPGCVRAALTGETLVIRNPNAVRPYQHVLEPLTAYLMIAKRQYEEPGLADCYNIGPDRADCATTEQLVKIFSDVWGGIDHTIGGDNGPREAVLLMLDNTKIKRVLGWRPVWSLDEAVRRVAEWHRAHRNGEDVVAVMDEQIGDFLTRSALLYEKRE